MKICSNPYCRYENLDSNKFCEECGHSLPTQVVRPQKREIRFTPVVVISGVSGILFGGLIILGWLTPWISLGGLGRFLLSFLNFGSGLPLFDFGAGIGNGLQLSLLMLVGSVAALSNSETVLLGLFGLPIAFALFLIPVLAVLNIRLGFKLFERDQYGDNNSKTNELQINTKKLRNRFSKVFLILVIIFIILAILPFITGILGRGFYLTLLGSVLGFLATFAAQRILGPQSS